MLEITKNLTIFKEFNSLLPASRNGWIGKGSLAVVRAILPWLLALKMENNNKSATLDIDVTQPFIT